MNRSVLSVFHLICLPPLLFDPAFNSDHTNNVKEVEVVQKTSKDSTTKQAIVSYAYW